MARAVAMVVFALPSAGCALLGMPTSAEIETRERAVEVVDVDVEPWFPTWRAAALAEARRLHPRAAGLTAERLDVPRVGPRIQVRARGRQCWWYGSLKAGRAKWRANEIGPC